ncbi:MAG: GIY-YIG nuclease family protein [bacterium]
MYYVYILFSLKDQKFYIGFTHDLKRRMTEHSTGKVPSTKPRLPLKLIFYEAHLSKIDAQRRENYFKTEKGKSTLRQMLRSSLKDLVLVK